MRKILFSLFLLLFLPSVTAFSIVDYQSYVYVQEDGSIDIYEKMTFDLEQQYSEGYRSIRKEDFDLLSDITVNSVKVNGASAPYATQMYGDQAEIVWKKTYKGTNVVELNYTISDRVELYNDFAKLCFEHYGADWKVSGQKFNARTTLPPKSAGKTMHFEVYSTKQGKAYVDNLSIVVEMDNVPSGNYVGGCYLFDLDSVQTTNTVDDFAYTILKKEREIYGSKTVLEAERPNLEFCCFPAFLLSLILAISLFRKDRERPRLPESILPPGKDEPAVVSALVRNKYEIKELVAATIVDLINRNIIDILELEKKGAAKGAEIKRERTILFLKKRPKDLKDYEKSVIDLIFAEGKEVDLDAKMKEYGEIESKSDAKKLPIVGAVKKFNKEFEKQIKALFTDKEIKQLSKAEKGKSGLAGLIIFGFIFLSFVGLGYLVNGVGWYLQHSEWLLLGMIAISSLGFGVLSLFSYSIYYRPQMPKTPKNQELFVKWDAFYRGLKASRIKEHPPSSAVIWGEILTYATALGLADKVKRHLSELDPVLAKKVESMDDVAETSMAYYLSAVGVRNLATYGNRSGAVSGAHGGFSSASSGGWSGGGGGFSGGSSGGGGFR